MLRAIGLSDPIWQSRFSKSLFLAAAMHDLGKANNHFQPAVHGTAAPDDRQAVRHEWISVWIAMQSKMKEWLLPAVDGCEDCWHITMFAIGGHHRKDPPDEDRFKGSDIQVLAEHSDFQKCLFLLRDRLELDERMPEVARFLYRGAGDREGKENFLQMTTDLGQYWRSLKKDHQWKAFCGVMKATLIAADVAASALWEKIEQPTDRIEWIKSSLGKFPSQKDLSGIVKARLGEKPPYPFQTKAANSSASVTLLEAGCGGGKSAAAYMWAAKQHAGKRLWFCYPTTGTATEGYRGYLFDKLPEDSSARAGLFHSRQDYDLKVMLESRADDDFDFTDAAVRVESLKAWDTQVVACTVDSVLFLLQNQRRGIYAWPAFANAAIVFDEIHCYDDRLFGNLLSWLEIMVGIPVLLMTASLPNAKRDAIRQICEEAQRSLEHIPSGPPELENLPRYRNRFPIQQIEAAGCEEPVLVELAESGRVLWISNTVARTCKVGEHFFDAEPIYYHSRFIYKHRLGQHTETVSLFESGEKPGFASTSQVAEMSLDLAYATLLVTELAPIPALIQRLGRLNRRANPKVDPPVVREFIVVEPMNDGEFSSAPYEDEELDLARQWLKRLGDGPISQADLVRHWLELDETIEIGPEDCGWIEGGHKTPVDSIRESSYGITVICSRHLAAAKKEGATAYVLPMNRPVRKHWQATEYRLCGFPIASDDSIDYDYEEQGATKKGAKWATHNQY